jgi:hypothetical protein
MYLSCNEMDFSPNSDRLQTLWMEESHYLHPLRCQNHWPYALPQSIGLLETEISELVFNEDTATVVCGGIDRTPATLGIPERLRSAAAASW